MNGLIHIPNKKDLEKSYFQLQHKKIVSESDIVLFSQWSRFDARLAEVVVHFLSMHWMLLHPIKIHLELKKQPWPATFGVLCEFSEKSITSARKLWKCWKKTVLNEIKPADSEQFFIGLQRLGSPTMLQNAEMPINEYSKWGYLSREILFNKPKLKTFKTHSFSFEVRYKILMKLLTQNKRITISDYLLAIDHSISKRTAERDLSKIKSVKKFGNTKGTYYSIIASSKDVGKF